MATEHYQATMPAVQSSNDSKLCWAALFRHCARCHFGDQHYAGLYVCCQLPPRKLEGLLGFAVVTNQGNIFACGAQCCSAR